MGMTMVARRLTPPERALADTDPEQLADVVFETDDDRTVDLDKAWHAVHFLLTGTAWDTEGDVGEAVFGGREVGEDLGYGPLRLLEADDAQRVWLAIAGLDEQQLRSRFDPDRMVELEIYPAVWDRPDERDELLDGFVLPALRELAGLYARAAAEEQPVVLALA